MSTFESIAVRTVDQAILSLHGKLVEWQPLRLQVIHKQIREQCGDALVDVNRMDRFDASVRQYLAGGFESLNTLDHLMLAYGISQSHPELNGQGLLGEEVYLDDLLNGWTGLCRQADSPSAFQIWRGIFLAVFKTEAGHSGLDRARSFLSDTWLDIRSRRPAPQWVSTLHDHAELLGRTPANRYAADWLNGSRESVRQLSEVISIPSTSWFWADLVGSIVRKVCETTNDAKFREQFYVALDLCRDHCSGNMRLSNQVLATVLDRYAACTSQIRDERLLSEILTAWGSPQLNLSSKQHLWSAASDEARHMVCSWLAEEDLQDFDELCRRAQQVDGRRLAYWLRFKRQISYSKLVLGDALRQSNDADTRNFRERKKGRLAWLTPQPSALNNAIILRIGDWWLMEFSETGNAFHPFLDSKLKFDPGKSHYSLYELKPKSAVAASGAEKLTHQNRNWEEKFDRFLSDRGIWPDKVGMDSVRRKVANAEHSKPVTTTSVAESLKVPQNFNLSFTLLAELSSLGARTVDNRPKGGPFWILIPEPPQGIKNVMSEHGFKFAESRGFYHPKK